MSSTSKPLQQRLFSWLWRRPWFRREFYNALGLLFRRKTDWQMMNCGYLAGAPVVRLDARQAAERHGYELYAQLVAGTPLASRDVLELGAGRGGGARFLHSTRAPRRLVALDYTPGTVRWCRRHFSAPGLEFVSGDAMNPPFPPATFDVLVAVEVTHCLADKARFLGAAARILRPGGRLLIADFFYRRPDAMHALGKFEAALAAGDFAVAASDDWTPAVIAAIEDDSERRAAEIRASVPAFLQKTALGFTSTTSSSTYVALREGRAVYRRYVLERRA
jgi:ubiquinone/menaquinone biosynthesis C-methylase UbiE